MVQVDLKMELWRYSEKGVVCSIQTIKKSIEFNKNDITDIIRTRTMQEKNQLKQNFMFVCIFITIETKEDVNFVLFLVNGE